MFIEFGIGDERYRKTRQIKSNGNEDTSQESERERGSGIEKEEKRQTANVT